MNRVIYFLSRGVLGVILLFVVWTIPYHDDLMLSTPMKVIILISFIAQAIYQYKRVSYEFLFISLTGVLIMINQLIKTFL